MKIVIDNKIPFIRGVFEPFADVVYLPGKDTTPDVVRDADALITRTRTICNESLLKGSSVKVIATATIGYDHIDTAWCERNGIFWTNAPGCNSWSVKQYIASTLVTLAARYGLELDKMTLGVIGVGNVGSKVAEAAGILGMKVLLNDPPRARREGGDAFVGLDELLSQADIITVHVPLEKEGPDATWHLFDAARIATLRPTQILINSSRGPVVDNQALKAALLGGRLKAAVLDVWEGEPAIDTELMSMLAVATPHIAGYSADGKANGTSMSVRAVARALGIKALEDWTASGVPTPVQPLSFELDCTGKTTLQILSEAVLYTYRVEEDSRLLKADPSLFEKLRGDYRIRREPTAFSIKLANYSEEQKQKLALMGFNVK